MKLSTKVQMWPTPSAHKQTASGELTNADGSPWDGTSKPHSAKTGQPVQTALMDAVKMWPTPQARDYKGAPGAGCMARGGHQSSLPAAIKLWPTPTCHMAKECDAPSEANRNEPTLTHQARGGDTTQPSRLNPEWVEWLMGWPLGWTALKPLETDKYPQWRHSHGGF